jgi:hypothetical protein
MKSSQKLEKRLIAYASLAQFAGSVLLMEFLARTLEFGVEFISTKATYLESLINIKQSETGLIPGKH